MAKRIFLGNECTLPVTVAAGLAELKPAALPDFGRILLVLPGKVARSNVRRELLKHYPRGLLLPQLLTPHLLMHYGLPEANLPSPVAEEIIWGRVLQRAAEHKEDFPEIFPAGLVPVENFVAAGQLRQLRLELAAGGFSIADAAASLGSRGGELSRLEYRYCQELAGCGLTDPLACDRQAVQDTGAFAGVEKIILAGLPDVPQMLQQKLALIDEKFPGLIEIWIGDHENMADLYDEWGVPVVEKWENLPFNCDTGNIHVAVDPADGARRAMILAGNHGLFDPEECAIVLADQSLYEDFAREFADLKNEEGRQVTIADPSGVPLKSLRLCRLGKTLLEYLKNADDFLYASELIRQEDFLIYLAGGREKCRELLQELDEFQLDMMPDNFDHALRHIAAFPAWRKLEKALQRISFWKKQSEKLSPAGFLRDFFTDVYRNRPVPAPVMGVDFDAECDFFTGALENFAALPEKLTGTISKITLIEIFFRNCRNEKITTALPPGALYFEGRLEMPFLTQKRLIFCGVNEKFFPDRIDLTPFLTDSIRQKIGIRSNRETLARSLCHLAGVSASRRDGDLQLIVLRSGSDGSALRPSGIFFGGNLPEKTLLARCAKLFRDPPALKVAESPAGNKEFFLKAQLDFKRDENQRMNLSVTDLDNYLSAPFIFWWENVLKMQSVDYSRCEPDPALGGTLCHEAFEKLPSGRRFPSAEALEKALHANFDATLCRRFGSPLPVLLKLFAVNMKQRLSYGAKLLFESQNDGFELLATEYKFGGSEQYVIFQGAAFRGKVDRIEYNRRKNILRVIDIKTGKVDNVIKEHCRFDRRKQLSGFKRLQLPAYVLLLKNDPAFRELCPMIDSAEIECAYLALPSEVTASALEVWPADDLAQVLPVAESEIGRIVEEIRHFPQQQLPGDPEKLRVPLLQPDTLHALRGFRWLKPENGECAEDIQPEKSGKSAGKTLPVKESAVPQKRFPALPELDFAGRSRCCDCPPEIRSKCGCCGGDCAACRSFNGFKSFNIITASAGTGKTYSLASRFIQLLSYGAEPESILAITFTKKAAGEIFDRIVRRICELALKPERPENRCLQMDHEQVISLIRKLLGNHTRELQISTIDSFFMQLLQAFAPELGIWGDIAMTDESDDRFLRRTIHRWIRSIPDGVQLDALRELLKEAGSGDTRSIYAAIYELAQSVHHFYQLKIHPDADGSLPQLDRVPWQNLPVFPDSGELQELTGELRFEAEKISAVNEVMARRLTALAGMLEKCTSGVMYGKLDGDVESLLKILNEKNGGSWPDDPADAPLTYWRGCAPPPSLAPLLRRAFRHIRAAALRQCRAKNLAVFGLIAEFDRIYGKYVRSAGNITFSDLPALLTAMDENTRQIILGPSDHSLEFRLDRQIRHYMFDEFQDTSDVQMRVFDPLLRELFSQLDTGEFRSFFCVGDIKQSIYQWRDGNPELFNYVTNLLRPVGEQLGYTPADSLVRSYRSSQAVLDTVNAVFGSYDGNFELFHRVLRQMQFQFHISSDLQMPGHTALINVAQSSPQSAQNIPAKSAVINTLLQQSRALQRHLTVGVLVSTNAVAREFAEVLKSVYQLPVSVDGTVSPVDSMAFSLFRELLILAEHPGDAEAGKFLDMLCFAAPEDVPELLTREKLAVKLGFDPALPLDEAVREELFINGLAGFAKRFLEVFRLECTPFDRRRLEILNDAAAAFDGSAGEFLRQIDRLGKSDNSLDETIQIMTCHKAKGLEFDVVFMPDLIVHNYNGGSCLPEAEIIHYGENEWADTIQTPAWVTYLPDKHIAENVPQLAEHLQRKESDRLFEKCCALYVGMTRAKSALYMLTSRNNITGAFSPDKLLMEQLPPYGVQNSDTQLQELLSLPELAGYQAQLLFSHGDWHWYIQYAPEIAPAGEGDNEPAVTFPVVREVCRKVRAASGEKSAASAVAPGARFTPFTGKNTGTAVHELFEKLHFAGDSFDAAEFCAVHGAEPAAAEIFIQAMDSTSPVRQIFGEPDGEYELWCERRFLLINRAGEMVPGAFDRVVIHKENGVPVWAEIFDYKSDKFTSAADFAVYFPQLQSYRESLAVMLDIPPEKIKGFICALKIRQVIEVFT
ncbi:MAG: UvrD-helicase domain-containing protein [Lentisphaeria bacterium]|nr:UvrD-helicase domain-containing protein [Lentisphaeria bacterium]